MKTGIKMEVMNTLNIDGEAEETSASTEAGCSETLDLSRLIRIQLLWGHTTPAILGIRGERGKHRTSEALAHGLFRLGAGDKHKGFYSIHA